MPEISISIPISALLDQEGFISRECPNPSCLRQFRVHNASPEQDSYTCPYCATPAGADSWWTKEQLKFQEEVAWKVAEEKLLGPLQKQFKDMARRSGGSIRYKEGRNTPTPAPRPPAQADAGRLVTPPCHPEALLNVREDWQGPVHCFACGTAV